LVLWISSDGEVIQTVDCGSYPRGLLRDGAGNIYVTLPENQSIQKLSPEGELLWEVDINWFSLSYMMMDTEGNLYVTDIMHSVVLMLSDTTAIPPVPLEPKPIQTDAAFSFTISSDTISEEDPVSLKVIGKDIEKCAMLELSIQYPAELLTYQSMKIGSAFKGTDFKITENSENSGFLLITFISKKGDTFNDSGELIEIQFIASHFGSGKIEFSNIVMQNNMGVDILYKNKTDLSFTVQSNDKTPPALKLQPIPQLVYHPSLLIQGETEPEATVTINQKPVEVKSDGKFELTVDLQKGKNKILIMATDKSGNKTEISLKTTLRDKIIIKLYVGSKVIIINETPGVLDSEPYIDKNSGRTMVPLRAIGEAIGATVTFEPKEQRVDIVKNSVLIQLWIGRPKARINGVSVDIDPDKPVYPVIVKGRTFLPLRFIAEAFEFKVDWDAPTQRITLTYPKE
jgi:hypothetical protein